MTDRRCAARADDLSSEITRRRRRCGALCVIALFASEFCSAQTVSGSGARTCHAVHDALNNESEAALDSFVAWSQGFVSGFNWSNVRQQDVRIDSSALLHWLGQYCAANPRDSVYAAVQELIRLNAR
jgi:hypothetical protein